MPNSVLIKTVSNNVGTLKINRPEQRNALSPDLLIDLHLTLKEWAEKDIVRVAVITGNTDKVFSSGFDITAIPTDISTEAAEAYKTSNPLDLALDSIRDFPFPVIAMVNGICFGAGLNLAMCCDMRIGSDQIKACMPPAKLGLVYPASGLSQFVEVIGLARTRELFYTASVFSGEKAKDMGLVDYLVPSDKLTETVYGMAKEIAKNAPLSLKGMKKIINMIGKYSIIRLEDQNEAQTLVAEPLNSDDLKEGQAAFFEKRSPIFTGR